LFSEQKTAVAVEGGKIIYYQEEELEEEEGEKKEDDSSSPLKLYKEHQECKYE
jgi:hypothetical protein